MNWRLKLIMDTHEGDINTAKINELLVEYDQLNGKLNKFIQYVDNEWQ